MADNFCDEYVSSVGKRKTNSSAYSLICLILQLLMICVLCQQVDILHTHAHVVIMIYVERSVIFIDGRIMILAVK